MGSINPYQTPAPCDAPADAQQTRKKYSVYVAWAVVFVLNMIVPLGMGWMMTNDRAKLGLWMATALLLAGSECLCVLSPRLARSCIVGAIIVALSQLFPILQFMAGIFAFSIADVLGLITDHDPAALNSELGGFVVTLITGSTLLLGSFGIGLVIRIVTPRRWWSFVG